MFPTHFWLFQAAFVLQVLALGLFVSYALAPRRARSLAATLALTLSLAFLLFYFVLLGHRDGRLPLSSGFEFLLLWGIALTALVVWVEWRHQLGLLGAFVTPPAVLVLLMVFRFARADAVPKPGLPAGWLLLHVLGLVVASACFTTAAGVAGAWLVQARQLKRKALDALSYELPPLESLDGLAAGLAAAGLLTWVLGLLAGFVWRLNWDGQWGLGDPSVLFALGIAVAYGVALFLRARGALRGRRLALLFILLFLVILFGYYLVNLYFGGHGFLQSKLGA